MARIESVGTSIVQPFDSVADVSVSHSLGHRPVVQILIRQPGGMYGYDGYGNNGYGYSEEFVPLADANFFLVHEDDSNFRVLMNNYYTGEIVFI